MVVHSIENKNAFFFPFRAVKTPDAEEFILENAGSVLPPVESSSFHNQYHLNNDSVSYNCAENKLN